MSTVASILNKIPMDIKNQIKLKPLKDKLRHYLLSGYCMNV